MKCHDIEKTPITPADRKIALVGHPNVGKSAIFQKLTGRHVVISNYPGTTIEITYGTSKALNNTQIIDTPGLLTFPPQTDDERATEKVLLHESLDAIVQVGDAKNIRRTLMLTIQLVEMGKPFLLALNMKDEADARGVKIDVDLLSKYLSVPIISTIATHGGGIDELVDGLSVLNNNNFKLNYPNQIERVIAEICKRIPASELSPRSLALLFLAIDRDTEDWVKGTIDEDTYRDLAILRENLQVAFVESLSETIHKTRLEYVDHIVSMVLKDTGEGRTGWSHTLGRLSTHPVWGIPILLLVLGALYYFVGVFGAGTLVNYLETKVFGEIVNPKVLDFIVSLHAPAFITEFFIGKYGLWTMGVTYALVLIFPIVTTFFIAYGIMEDSGYLPRLAALSNNIFKLLGLNGRAILPMVLGLGCVTMATLTTRVLETKRDKLLVTLLLALAIPCSAQLGVVMGMLASISLSATIIWSMVVLVVFIFIGWLSALLVPGERSMLLIELPPLRMPLIANITTKTLARLEWYLKEVVPLFLLGTTVMFLLDKVGILPWLIKAGEPLVVGWLGLPADASAAFLMGFFRRDFGATGLFVMKTQGLLNPLQVVVAMVTITLFIPCIASIFMIAKERGVKTTIGMVLFIFPLAFFIAGILNRVLIFSGWMI